jgi:hypothetical protein
MPAHHRYSHGSSFRFFCKMLFNLVIVFLSTTPCDAAGTAGGGRPSGKSDEWRTRFRDAAKGWGVMQNGKYETGVGGHHPGTKRNAR